jgi:hypothetical protein
MRWGTPWNIHAPTGIPRLLLQELRLRFRIRIPRSAPGAPGLCANLPDRVGWVSTAREVPDQARAGLGTFDGVQNPTECSGSPWTRSLAGEHFGFPQGRKLRVKIARRFTAQRVSSAASGPQSVGCRGCQVLVAKRSLTFEH